MEWRPNVRAYLKFSVNGGGIIASGSEPTPEVNRKFGWSKREKLNNSACNLFQFLLDLY